MNKYSKIGILTLLIFSIVFTASSENKKDKSKDSKPSQNSSQALRSSKNETFGYGERLDYKVKYSFVTAGEGYFHILPKPLTRNGRDCFDIRFQVNSLQSLEWLYKVKDNYRTVLDQTGIFPWEFEQNVREGNYKRDFTAWFDPYLSKAFAENKEYKVPPYCHDIVSAFYYVRTLNLGAMKKGTVFYLQNFFGDQVYKLGVKILGKQTVEVEAGKFNCVMIEPLVVEGGLFKSEGQILIWVTDDDRKIPVKVFTKILIGNVSAELVKFSGLKGPCNAKID